MKRSMILVAASCSVALLAAAPAAFAQRGGGGHGGGGAGRMGGGGVSIGHGGTRPMSPGPVASPRIGGGVHVPPMMPRGSVPVGGLVRGGHIVPGGGPFVGHWSGAPVHFLHPYYAFRPHVHVGLGIWAGYPFLYSYPYYYPYYSYTYVYPPLVDEPYGSTHEPDTAYTPPSSTEALAAQTNTGGLSFDVTPSTAELIVDGNVLGTVGQFTPATQPLGLRAGRHHIELRAAGYQALSFEVDIVAGQVIPYQGSLERQKQ